MRKQILILMILPVLLLPCSGIAFSSDFPSPGDSANRDENRLVYMAWYEASWDIFMKDTVSGQITRITDNKRTQGYPDIWDKYIVWQDNRNYSDTGLGGFDIYLYNLDTGETKKISQTEGYHQNPLIKDNKVVWVDHRGGKKVYLYDIAADRQEKISSDSSRAVGVIFDGDNVAWVDFRNGGEDVYMYDAGAEKEKQITGGKDVYLKLTMDGGKVAWAEKDEGNYALKTYDSETEGVETLASGDRDYLPVSMSKEKVLVKSEGKLSIIDTGTKEETPIEPATNSGNITLQGDRLVWTQNGQVSTEPLEKAMARAGAENDSTRDNKPAKDTKQVYLQPQKQEKVTTPDGKAEFTFKPGTFNKETSLTLEQEKFEINGFIPVSPVYTPSSGAASVQKPVTVTVKYTVPGNKNYRKAALYQKQGNSWTYVPFTREDKDTVMAEIDKLLPLAVLIKPTGFKDTKGHWSREDVEVMASHGIINGFPGDTFRPEKEITRAEFAAILAKSSHLTTLPVKEKTFSDVPANHF